MVLFNKIFVVESRLYNTYAFILNVKNAESLNNKEGLLENKIILENIRTSQNYFMESFMMVKFLMKKEIKTSLIIPNGPFSSKCTHETWWTQI